LLRRGGNISVVDYALPRHTKGNKKKKVSVPKESPFLVGKN